MTHDDLAAACERLRDIKQQLDAGIYAIDWRPIGEARRMLAALADHYPALADKLPAAEAERSRIRSLCDEAIAQGYDPNATILARAVKDELDKET
jgi:hypothetical protein